MSGISEKDKFVELLLNIRHYSTLRFAMLTVYMAANGGMLNKFFDCGFATANPQALSLFQVAGVALAIAFLVFECALNHNLSDYWDSITRQVGSGDAFVANRTWLYRFSVPLATHSIFVLSGLFWWYWAGDFYPCRG